MSSESPAEAHPSGSRIGRVGFRPSRRGQTLRSVALLISIDAAAWAVALFLGVATRYDWQLDEVGWVRCGAFLALTVAVHLVTAQALGLYRGRYRAGSADEAVMLAAATAATAAIMFAIDLLQHQPPVPRSVALVFGLLAFTLAESARVVLRARQEQRARHSSGSRRVIVLGADARGRALVQSMVSGAESGYDPVAILDDDAALRGSRVCGVPVRGSHLAVAEVARRYHAELLLVAVRTLSPEVLGEVSRLADAVGLDVKIVPPLSDRLSADSGLALEDLDVNALLGRTVHDPDVAPVATYLTGKRVLVTGAGGSIGSELCRQLVRHAPAELLMLDRDESALHAVQLSIYGTALLDSPDVILCDLRDAAAIARVFTDRRPDVVFHAAALKHLPMLEQYPDEAWKTNVLGTAHVLEAAERSGVTRLVNVSTDKAADPTSVLGRSKRIGERLVAGASPRGATYLSVRFGNVLGSRGSVLTTFCEQLAAGGPMTVTHPEVSRFFMTIPEAVALVIQAGAIGRPGEALVLDMGEPVRIRTVAEQLMALAGKTVPVIYTGLREGEKLHERVFGQGEDDERPFHPAISHVTVPPLAIHAVVTGDTDDMAALTTATTAVAALPDGWSGATDTARGPEVTIPAARRGSLVLHGPWVDETGTEGRPR